jgi:hypothetical protein
VKKKWKEKKKACEKKKNQTNKGKSKNAEQRC